MKKTIEIEDTLQERVDQAIEEVRELLAEHKEEYPEDGCPGLSELDDDGRISEIVDSNVSVYNSEIRNIWYLHSDDLEEAYENAGIGTNPRENSGMAAIYCHIEQKVNDWFGKEAEDFYENI